MGDLISKHGGYRKLHSFQCAQQVYDATVIFCRRGTKTYQCRSCKPGRTVIGLPGFPPTTRSTHLGQRLAVSDGSEKTVFV